MTAKNASQVTLLSNPCNASPLQPVNGSTPPPLVPTKDTTFSGAGSLANISHTLPSHTGEAPAVCTAGLIRLIPTYFTPAFVAAVVSLYFLPFVDLPACYYK